MHEDAVSFAQKLIVPAANIASYAKASTAHATHNTDIALTKFPKDSIQAFLYRTAFLTINPHLPRHRRHFRFYKYYCELRFCHSRQSHSSTHRAAFPSAHVRCLPGSVRREPRTGLFCVACRSVLHLLCYCPKRLKYQTQMHEYLHLGETATYSLSLVSDEVSVDEHRVLHVFNDSEYSLIGSAFDTDATADILSYTWLADLLETFDAWATSSFLFQCSQIQPSPSTRFSSFCFHQSLPRLSVIMEGFLFHAHSICNAHFLLDTVVPKTTCGEARLE